jgi:metal-sulfur cluster biosynthetic enzyme
MTEEASSNSQTGKQAVWQAESTHPLLMKPLRDGLSTVYDPEIRLTILELGLVRNVVIEENHALITMILTTPFCPYGPVLLEAARQKAEEALGMPVEVELGSEYWNPSFMANGVGDNWGLF